METILSFSTMRSRTLSMAYLFNRIAVFTRNWPKSDVYFSAPAITNFYRSIQLARQVVDELQTERISLLQGHIWRKADAVVADHKVESVSTFLHQADSNLTIRLVWKRVLHRIGNEFVDDQRARNGGIDVE